MAGNDLIERYVAALERRLPRDIVDELADGITQAYAFHEAAGLAPEEAARVAVAEFGDPDTVIHEFVRQAPGRRAALLLLCCGPAVGICWMLTLIAGHAANWPVPTALAVAVATTLGATIAMILLAATSRLSYRRTRLAVPAGIAVIVLDATIITATAVTAPAFVWPMALAIPASLTRLTLTVRAMPRVLAR